MLVVSCTRPMARARTLHRFFIQSSARNRAIERCPTYAATEPFPPANVCRPWSVDRLQDTECPTDLPIYLSLPRQGFARETDNAKSIMAAGASSARGSNGEPSESKRSAKKPMRSRRYDNQLNHARARREHWTHLSFYHARFVCDVRGKMNEASSSPINVSEKVH